MKRTSWPPRLWWVVFFVLALQVVVVYGPAQALGESRRWLILVSYLLLFPPVAANWHLWGVRIMGLGLVMNFLAIAANGGWMPVTPEVVERAGLMSLAQAAGLGGVIPGSKAILLPQEAVHLYPLTDSIVLHFPWAKVYSPGDLVLLVGLVVAVISPFWRIAFSKRTSERAQVTT